jgi:DNA polymerase-3 subunit beta
MRFTFRTGELSVSAASMHGGEGEDVLPCDYSGPEIAVGFNPRYILEFIDAAPEGKLQVWIKNDHAATEWRPKGDDEYRYVAMPLALNA